jgi:glycosyltransferase involved in cell wall biosynthesis
MNYWFVIVLVILCYQLLVVIINLVTNQQLPKATGATDDLISILIPARDEETNIQNILTDLTQQPYRNIEICVYDDQSTDHTSLLVERFAALDSRVKLLKGTELPVGWKGKNYACWQLAYQARGEYLLFVDADVRVSGDVVSQTIHYMKQRSVSMLSIFPNQQMLTNGEWQVVPIMNHILLSLLPLRLVELVSFPSLAAANGQWMMYRKSVYERWLPHQTMKSENVEDIKIARYLKRNGERIACFASEIDLSCRMYKSYGEAVNGFSKNVIMFFGNSYLLSFVYAIVGSVMFWPLMQLGWFWLVLFVLTSVLCRIITSYLSHQDIKKNLVSFLLQQLNLVVIIIYSLQQRITKRTTWKGRLV